MQPRRIRIATSGRIGPPRWWWVRVHRDAEHMRAAAHRHAPEYGRQWWEDCYACCQPVRWLECEDDPSRQRYYPANGYAGIIRYVADWLTAEVVTHELAHAAIATYRMNVHPNVRLGLHCRDREEALAYLFGELYADLERQL